MPWIVILGTIIATFFFLIGAGLLFRHAKKYSYLSPRFKITVGILGLISMMLLVAVFYFLVQLIGISGDSDTFSLTPSSNEDANF